jgi:hypothetical protein
MKITFVRFLLFVLTLISLPRPAPAGERSVALNATVMLTGYIEIVAGCNVKPSVAASELLARSCEQQSGSSVTRWSYRCAGVVIGLHDRHATTLGILTARHCVMPTTELVDGDVSLLVPEQQTIKAVFRDGDVGDFLGVAVGVLDRDDVALIRVDTSRPHPDVSEPDFTIADHQQLYVLGHSHESPWGIKSARSIDGLKPTGIEDWAHTSMLECPECADGDSGAGVWDSHWRLVGIFNAITAEYGLYTSSERIRQAMAH